MAGAPVGRRPELSELGLPEGCRLQAVLHVDLKKADGQRKLSGRLMNGAIEVEGRGALTPEQFLAVAGYPKRYSAIYKYIRAPDLDITLADRAEGGERDQGSQRKRIEVVLRDKYKVQTLGEMEAYLQAHPMDGCAYRVARLDEKDFDTQGIAHNSTMQPWRQRYAPNSPAVDYVSAVSDHIFNGSKQNRRRLPFISATTCLRTALSYSYGGCHQVVKIDLAAAAGAGALALDMGGSLNELSWEGMAQRFAIASREVVLDAPIPAACCKVLKIDWYPLNDRILSDHKNTPNKMFPMRLDKIKLMIVEELIDGTSKPLKVQRQLPAEAEDSSSGRGKKRRKVQTTYVLKRSGGAGPHTRAAHIVSESCALAIYAKAGLDVPRSALYTVKVQVASEGVGMMMKFLLIEWLEGSKPSQDSFRGDSVPGKKRQEEFARGLALDVAMSNLDAAGPGFSNLLLGEGGKVIRLDLGACGFYDFCGKDKRDYLFMLTGRDKVQQTFEIMARRPGAATRSSRPGSSSQGVSQAHSSSAARGLKADVALEQLMTGVELSHVGMQAKQLLRYLPKEVTNLQDSSKTGLPETVLDTWERTYERLKQLASFAPGGSLHLPFNPQLKEIAVVRVQSARQNKNGVYSAKFSTEYIKKGYKVVDVTSKGDHKELSPFTAVGSHEIPVPGQPGVTARSVEGIWQGLKVFEGWEDDRKKDVDTKKFTISNGKNIKRTKRKFGNVAGHAWCGDDGTEPRRLLSYKEARKRIYVPALTWVLQNVEAVQEKLRELALAATKDKIVLLDYFTNDDLEDERQPLSHAGLIRRFLLENYQSLLSINSPGPRASGAGPSGAQRERPRSQRLDTIEEEGEGTGRITGSGAETHCSNAADTRRLERGTARATAGVSMQPQLQPLPPPPQQQRRQHGGQQSGQGSQQGAASRQLTIREKSPKVAADILLQGARGWLDSSQVLQLLYNYEEWGLPTCAQLPVNPAAGQMFLVEVRSGQQSIHDGRTWIDEVSSPLNAYSAVIGRCTIEQSADGLLQRCTYRLIIGSQDIALVHYLQCSQ